MGFLRKLLQLSSRKRVNCPLNQKEYNGLNISLRVFFFFFFGGGEGGGVQDRQPFLKKFFIKFTKLMSSPYPYPCPLKIFLNFEFFELSFPWPFFVYKGEFNIITYNVANMSLILSFYFI